jgi:excisionase family DNA binding protein
MNGIPNVPGYLRLSEAARLLSIGDTTLKRWTEEGRIPCERTLGGHRRFRVDDVQRLRSQLLGEAPPSAPKPPEDPADSRQWLDAPDPAEPTALLGRLMILRSQSQNWAEAGDRLCSGLLSEIGERWMNGKMTCAQEHVMSRSVEVALTRVAHQLPVLPGAPKMILACIPGERHTLGLTLVETVLRERGINVRFLGADVPTHDIVETIHKERPLAVGLSASCHPRPQSDLGEPAKAVAQACLEEKARLFLGGGAQWPPVRGAIRALTLMDLSQYLDTITPRPAGV